MPAPLAQPHRLSFAGWLLFSFVWAPLALTGFAGGVVLAAYLFD